MQKNEVREWVAPNGHRVTVHIDSNTNSRATWGERHAYYVRTTYKCECGKQMTYTRSPLKAHMNDHDGVWMNPSDPEVIARRAMLAALIEATA
jgi:hypothetical protein